MTHTKKAEAIALVAIALTAIVSICAAGANTAEPDMTEPKETVSEPTAATTAPEKNEPAQVPTEVTTPDTEATEPPETTEATEATEESLATEPQVVLYAVPLPEDLQLYIIAQAEQYGIDPAIVVAMIWRESRYNASSIGDNGNSLGLMQIQPRWHQNRMDALGCPDLLDPFQNVTVGINILASHLERWDGNIEMAIVSYNAGATGAYNKYFSKGEYSSKYSTAVLEKAEELRGESYAFFR